MISHKFTRRRSRPGRPPVCKSKKPFILPYQAPLDPYYHLAAGGAHFTAMLARKPPPIPLPPFEPITTTNLIYHVYPHPGNINWLDNIESLLKGWHSFNGRRIIAIATSPTLVDPKAVESIFPKTCEFHHIPNEPGLREMASFPHLLKTIRNTSGNQATFYAHTKGSSQHWTGNREAALAVKLWRRRMYHELLHEPTRIRALLETYAMVGCFKMDYSNIPEYEMISPIGTPFGRWHYAGTFYWFRHDQVFRNPHWSAIPDDPYAAEMWPGFIVESSLATSVYQYAPPTVHPSPNLYDPLTHINPELGGPIR